MALTPFSQASLKKIVADTLAAEVPPGHKVAVVGAVDASGAQVVATFTLGQTNRWKLQGAIRHEWSGETSGAASVLYSR